MHRNITKNKLVPRIILRCGKSILCSKGMQAERPEHVATLLQACDCSTGQQGDAFTMQHTEIHCNTLHRTATHCNTLQHNCNTERRQPVAMCGTFFLGQHRDLLFLGDNISNCNGLHRAATRCNTLQHEAREGPRIDSYSFLRRSNKEAPSHCNALQRTATHLNTLQRTATHYNTLHHSATLFSTKISSKQ